jgi:hypothetical protein
MKPTVYLETSIIGYLATRTSDMLRVAANQQTTRDWCDNHRHNFEVFASRFVVIERICREMGFEPPVICTPQELLEIDDEF